MYALILVSVQTKHKLRGFKMQLGEGHFSSLVVFLHSFYYCLLKNQNKIHMKNNTK